MSEIHHCHCGSALWHLKYDGCVICAKCHKSPPNTHVIINEEPLNPDGLSVAMGLMMLVVFFGLIYLAGKIL